MMNNITFANPDLLYLLLLIIPMIGWYVLKQKNAFASIQVSSVAPLKNVGRTYKHYLRHLIFVFRLLAIALLIIALARPQATSRWENVTTEGIDIMLAIDISSSMLAQDFKPNRLDASKDVAIQFITGRHDDRIGLVVFSGESFTQCPLTTDHPVLVNLFKDIKSGIIEDGTAIGEGLATAVNRLKDSDAISKVIILLTDGVNNRGDIDPLTAAEIAKTFNIRVYTIGVGSLGKALSPVGRYPNGEFAYDYVKVEIDEKVLQEVASMTGGKYFRATSNTKLREIYNEIDQLEKSKIDVKEYSRKEEKFLSFLSVAGILLLLELLLRLTIFRNIP